MSEYKRYCE